MTIINKKAKRDYEIINTFEAGIKLTGAEVKSVKTGRMTLAGSHVRVVGNELFLVNAEIFPYPFARNEGYDSKRTRKILLHKKEIVTLINKLKGAKLTVIPLECYNTHGWIKLKIALVRGRREFEKREKLKIRDIDRNMDRVMKERGS